MLPQAVRSSQRAAERLMVDSCTIERVTGVKVDPLTGMDVPTVESIYAGKCKVQLTRAQGSTVDASGYLATIQDYELHIPVSAPTPHPGDVVTLTATPGDPERGGRQYRITAVFEKTMQSAQRLTMERDT